MPSREDWWIGDALSTASIAGIQGCAKGGLVDIIVVSVPAILVEKYCGFRESTSCS
jgi:hypothetical protein